MQANSPTSPLFQARTAKPARISIAVPEASPCAPSMMFSALATPPMAKPVNKIAKGTNPSSQSTGIRSTWVILSPEIPQKITPDRMVADSRSLTPTCPVMSSTVPRTKDGSSASRIVHHSPCPTAGITSPPASAPRYNATPPTRGA